MERKVVKKVKIPDRWKPYFGEFIITPCNPHNYEYFQNGIECYTHDMRRVSITQITYTEYETLVHCVEYLEPTDMITGAVWITRLEDLYPEPPLDTPARKVLFAHKGYEDE